MASYQTVERTRFFETICGVMKLWERQDTVAFSKLVDLTSVEALRRSEREAGRRNSSYTAHVIKAISLTLRDHPEVNRVPFNRLFLRRLIQLREVHAVVGVERELLGEDIATPTVLRNADRLRVADISAELAVRARCDVSQDSTQMKFALLLRYLPGWLNERLIALPGKWPILWMKYNGGSFLLTSPAKYGVDAIFVKSLWPMTFSFGLVQERPVARGGHVEVRPTTTLTLNWHRHLATGAVMARFFGALTARLERGNLDEESVGPVSENRVMCQR